MTKGVEHVIPESLGGKLSLPKGYVCDTCNNYFSDMDKTVFLNRFISLNIGMQQIPGKRGKIRKQIGEKLKFYEKDHAAIELGSVRLEAGIPLQKIDFKLEQSKEFNTLLFARGIHKIAFNALAYRFGNRAVLHSRFDKVRRYIRQPEKGELWHYAVKVSENIDSELTAIIHKTKCGKFVALHILPLDFLVSLTGWKKEIESKLDAGEIHIIRDKKQWSASSLLGL